MMRIKGLLCVLLCGMLFALPLGGGAQTLQGDINEEKALLEEAIVEGVAEEDLPVDEEQIVAAFSQEDLGPPSIQGLTPLYRTRIKLMTSTGTAISIRYAQDTESQVLGWVAKGEEITIYRVYPSFVLMEYEGKVGYIIRTGIDENCAVLDPATTPPYGVMPMGFVATLIADARVYQTPRISEDTHPIVLGGGNKIAIIGFEDGFAKIYYWRSYGYVDARQLTDLTVVAPTIEPLSTQTPIAAFSSYFAYNTGAEGNEGRCKNIVRSCELMTRVLQPGEQLDFNAQIGPYKRSNGYFPAPVLVAGGSQIGSGGGTCQSSSTMYNAIRQLPGISILQRRPHGPGSARYLPQHADAAVGTNNLNLIFRNDYPFPLRILAESDGRGVLTIQIFRDM